MTSLGAPTVLIQVAIGNHDVCGGHCNAAQLHNTVQHSTTPKPALQPHPLTPLTPFTKVQVHTARPRPPHPTPQTHAVDPQYG
jgi:hypothetical protein